MVCHGYGPETVEGAVKYYRHAYLYNSSEVGVGFNHLRPAIM